LHTQPVPASDSFFSQHCFGVIVLVLSEPRGLFIFYLFIVFCVICSSELVARWSHVLGITTHFILYYCIFSLSICGHPETVAFWFEAANRHQFLQVIWRLAILFIIHYILFLITHIVILVFKGPLINLYKHCIVPAGQHLYPFWINFALPIRQINTL